MATLTFANLHSTTIHFVDAAGKIITNTGQHTMVFIRLKAPLNLHPDKVDEAWVELKEGDGNERKYQPSVQPTRQLQIREQLFLMAIGVLGNRPF